ncbi:MAG: hypothetical protein ACYC2O_08225, partial [Microthrixaceae bacterium]
AKDGPAVASELAAALPGGEAVEKHLAHMLTEIGTSFLNYQVVAGREAEQRHELSSRPDLTLSVPYFEEDIHSLEGLLRLGEKIWR